MARTAFWIFAAIMALAPAAAAGPVDSCSQQCHPQDPDVNDPSLRSDGDVNAILYAHWVQDDTGFSLAHATVEEFNPEWESEIEYRFALPRANTGTGTPADLNLLGGWMINPAMGTLMEAEDGSLHVHYQSCLAQPPTTTAPWTLYAYFSAEASPNSVARSEAGVAPNVQVQAQWGSLTGSTVFAEGVSQPGVLVNLPGGQPLFEFQVPLVPTETPMGPCFNHGTMTVVRVYVHQLETDGQGFAQGEIAMRHGPDHPWRLVLPFHEPLWTSNVSETRTDGYLHVQWGVEGAMGGFDVDLDSFRIVFLEPDGKPISSIEATSVFRSTDHFGYLGAVKARWNLTPEQFPSGVPIRYRLEVQNLQNTFVLFENGNATTLAEPAPELPAPAAIPVLALVATVSFVLARRRT